MAMRMKPASRYAILAFAGLLLIGVASATSASRNVYNNIKTYSNILANVYDKYVEEVDSKELIYASIEGMMSTLDEHSAFLEKKQYEDLMMETQGRYGGVGISIDIRDDWLTVVSPIEGTPAFKLGIRAGDRIVAIEGESTKGITVTEAASKLRGRKGSTVTITIERAGELEPFDVDIERDVIELKSVPHYSMVRDGIGYLRLARFSEDSGNEVEAALADLVQQGVHGIIFDLRWNHGGLLTQAVAVADKFLERGKLISYTQGRHPEDRKDFRAAENPVVPRDIPLVVLVNGSTASASEIVSGALQDDGRAVILGELTYGKGLVQTLIPVDAEVNLKLTTAKWYTPSGRCIQRETRRDEARVAAAEVEEEPALEVEEEKEIPEPEPVGGIQPDVTLEAERSTRYAFELERQNMFFHFAVDYTTAHPEISRDFQADDELLGEFRSFLAGRDFSYETSAEREIERLRELAEDEEYGAGVFAALDSLLDRVQEEKTDDFEKNRDYIRFALEREILSKSFGTEGMYFVILRNDNQVQAAIDLILDEDAYESALQGKEAIAAVSDGREG
jgi:carboxyl-terminal processing protease